MERGWEPDIAVANFFFHLLCKNYGVDRSGGLFLSTRTTTNSFVVRPRGFLLHSGTIRSRSDALFLRNLV